MEPITITIDLLTDGQSGAGGFIRVFLEDGTFIDVNSEKEEKSFTEDNNIEPFIALLHHTARTHGASLVRDGNTQDEPFTLVAWENMVRANY